MVVWLATLRVWVRDDSPDLARTMAALDRHLRGRTGWSEDFPARTCAVGEAA